MMHKFTFSLNVKNLEFILFAVKITLMFLSIVHSMHTVLHLLKYNLIHLISFAYKFILNAIMFLHYSYHFLLLHILDFPEIISFKPLKIIINIV